MADKSQPMSTMKLETKAKVIGPLTSSFTLTPKMPLLASGCSPRTRCSWKAAAGTPGASSKLLTADARGDLPTASPACMGFSAAAVGAVGTATGEVAAVPVSPRCLCGSSWCSCCDSQRRRAAARTDARSCFTPTLPTSAEAQYSAATGGEPFDVSHRVRSAAGVCAAGVCASTWAPSSVSSPSSMPVRSMGSSRPGGMPRSDVKDLQHRVRSLNRWHARAMPAGQRGQWLLSG
mmetsp:Transcript_9060/g.27209  ORF Transcript_9060/g.27209 Transcript_9060/m.27209 type:complete len:234 (+) Transcript_9060:922-1623(+)